MKYGRVAEIACMCRNKAREGGLPAWQQYVELCVLYLFRRMGPGYYMQARFWRRNVPFRDKWRHAHQVEYLRYVHALNPPEYLKASQHKVTEKAVLQLLRIPTAEFFGYYHPVRGRDATGHSLKGTDDLRRVLTGHVGRRVCFKGVEGYAGNSFVALDVFSIGGQIGLRHPIDTEEFDVQQWNSRLNVAEQGWLLEEYLHQHPALQSINASSVNTIRMWVIEKDNGFRTVGAFLRVGRVGSQVDNTSRGGLACPIDLDTGEVRDALDLTLARNSHSVHPDSAVPIVGTTIPFWEECKTLAGDALAAFPEIRFAGLDIAVTKTGPVVVELNVEPDRRGAAHLDLPHRDLFETAANPL